jgi:hypothetical protein
MIKYFSFPMRYSPGGVGLPAEGVGRQRSAA